jgi:DHA1 family bicyclomycin/chloramphenicol resistance-like MFS transporter
MIVVLGVMVALGPLTIDMYLPALPKIADDLSVSSSVIQLTLTGTLAGLALGQLIVGPLSDSLGRRRPLMAGIVLHIAASVLCMLAPNLVLLGLARVLQGVGAAAAMVVAIAVVGDLFADSAAATVLSRLMLVLGVAPVVAPSLGAAVLLHGSWHWVFAALVMLAGALLLVAALALPETLPPSHRRPLRVRGIAATYAELLRDKRFVILVLVAALGMSGLFAYIAGASFVLQGTYGLDQQAFALVFGAGAVALIGATQFNVVLLKRFSPQAITLWALAAALLAGGVFVALSLAHVGGLAGFVVPVWAILAAMGLVIPNAPAIALSRHPDAAGTAAALLGAAQFGLGAAVAPLVGVLGNDELALSVVMAVSVLVALLALLAVGVSTSEDTDDIAVEDTVADPA